MIGGEQIYRHSTYSSVKAWRERGGRYRLEGSRCELCGTSYFPRRISCLRCNGRSMAPHECAPRGTVVVVWPQVGLVRLLGYADLPPRFVAIIRLDDGTHIESELVDVTEDEVNERGVGMPVRLVFRKLRRESNGNWCYGYKFAPAPNGHANDHELPAAEEK